MSNVFASVKGKPHGSWTRGGYTTSNLLENPAYIVESILRDTLGLTNINTDSFDALGTVTTGRRHGWYFARSIHEQENSSDTIRGLSHDGAFITSYDYQNKIRVVALDDYTPTEVITTADVLFEGKPLVYVRQSHPDQVRNEFYLHYAKNYGTGNHTKLLEITPTGTNLISNSRAGTPDTYTGLCLASVADYGKTNRWEYSSDWIRDDGTAEMFIKTMADWLAERHWITEIVAPFSAKTLKLEVGDQVNLNIDILPGAVRWLSHFVTNVVTEIGMLRITFLSVPPIFSQTMTRPSAPGYGSGPAVLYQSNPNTGSPFYSKGMQIERKDGKYTMIIDNLVVRNALTAFEFIVQQVKAHNGSLIISDTGSGKVFKGRVIT